LVSPAERIAAEGSTKHSPAARWSIAALAGGWGAGAGSAWPLPNP